MLVWVPICVNCVFNVGHNQPLKAFCDDQHEGFWSIVIQTCHCRALGDRDDGGCFHVGGVSYLFEGV